MSGCNLPCNNSTKEHYHQIRQPLSLKFDEACNKTKANTYHEKWDAIRKYAKLPELPELDVCKMGGE